MVLLETEMLAARSRQISGINSNAPISQRASPSASPFTRPWFTTLVTSANGTCVRTHGFYAPVDGSATCDQRKRLGWATVVTKPARIGPAPALLEEVLSTKPQLVPSSRFPPAKLIDDRAAVARF